MASEEAPAGPIVLLVLANSFKGGFGALLLKEKTTPTAKSKRKIYGIIIAIIPPVEIP